MECYLLYFHKLILLCAQPSFFKLLQLDEGVLAMEPLEEVSFRTKLEALGNSCRNKVLHPDGINRSPFNGNDVCGGHDANVRHQRGSG